MSDYTYVRTGFDAAYKKNTNKSGYEGGNNMADYMNNMATMEHCVRDYVLFIDTCSIIEAGKCRFWENITPLLEKYNKKLFVPSLVVKELEMLQNRRNEPDTARDAAAGYRLLAKMYQSGHIEIRGEGSDVFADNVFHTVFTKYRMTYQMLLITQDNNLAEDILHLNETPSVRTGKGKGVAVRRIGREGYLENFRWESAASSTKIGAKSKSVNPSEYHGKSKASLKNGGRNTGTKTRQDAFRVCSTVTSIPDDRMQVSHIPGEGEYAVDSAGHKVRLTSGIASGGEGAVYKTDTSYVAKIYKPEKNTRRKYEKIMRMLSKNISLKGICWPVSALYNDRNEFVGYLMPQAQGRELSRSVFLPKAGFERCFPDWKKVDTVQLCVTILEKLNYLHKRNVILGDINPSNILVVSPTEVYFVDTDSYQIEDLPCPVGTTEFTAPEIQGRRYAEFLRTKGNEDFAVAVLLFMIMLPGKHPYALQGGGNVAENIKNMDFAYRLGEDTNHKTPLGVWGYMWSHLKYEVKEMFYHTFRGDGDFAAKEKRPDVHQWLCVFKMYYAILKKFNTEKGDAMSLEIFPTRYKRVKGYVYLRCADCGREFYYTPEEIESYKAKGWNLSKRCFSCRQMRKASGSGRNTGYTSAKRAPASRTTPAYTPQKPAPATQAPSGRTQERQGILRGLFWGRKR